MGKVIKHDFDNNNVYDYRSLTEEQILRKIALTLEENESLGNPVRIRVESFNMLYNTNIVETMSFNE